MAKKDLITDVRLFPRSEYYTRFEGTTAFAMDDPTYWSTYHRSESTRLFHEAGGREYTQFSSPCAKKPRGKIVNSFFSHTGGISSPFSAEYYSEAITLDERPSKLDVNVRDALLLYKRQMAEAVVTSFAKQTKNSQKKKRSGRSGRYQVRPIVFYENQYPCILVELPVLNPVEAETESADYWSKHPKPFQRLLLACFIAFLNVEAVKAGIPIEMVIRASFGHNLPSVCETNNTFRINLGLIPKCYAKLIGKALHMLDDSINEITDAFAMETPFDEVFYAKVRHYNANKLKDAIDDDKKPRYKKLRNTRDYQKAPKSDEAFKRLYKAFCNINKGKPRKGGSNFVPVHLRGESIWEVIRKRGDTLGKSVLAECFRKNKTVDWFANVVMEALFNGDDRPIEVALRKLLTHLVYEEEKATMDYKKIDRKLLKPKREFNSLSFKKLYESDSAFDEITKMLFKAIGVKRPNEALYSELEYAAVEFFTTSRGSREISEDADFGSDSEFSDDLSELSDTEFSEEDTSSEDSDSDYGVDSECSDEESDDDTAVESELLKNHISHSKLRVCSGMKAILLAQYGALSYLRDNGIKTYGQDIEQMYYEVEAALKLVQDKKPTKNKVRPGLNGFILHYDLNYCNSSNASDNVSLLQKLKSNRPSIVVLDCTSSTHAEIKETVKTCFARSEVQVVISVDSGLKNNQGGFDFNPYGEVRVMARNTKTRDSIIKTMKKGLSEQDKLPPEAHELVRACKRRGLAVSLYSFFKGKENRSKVKDEPKVATRTRIVIKR